jgi:2-oxo-4-hydroxy-4-carboxy-5-ureidoimidazoline decarboxylase
LDAKAECEDDVNLAGERAAFVARYQHIFEHSPWVVERAYAQGPFADVAALHAAFMAALRGAGDELQLALIRAHPELGAKIALTEASQAEQTGAGLRALSEEEFARFQALNQAYREKFGFPFIICVRLHSKSAILEAFARRLAHDAAAEQAEAIAQIGQIALLRLQDLESA